MKLSAVLIMAAMASLVAAQAPPQSAGLTLGCGASPGQPLPECQGVTKQWSGDELECSLPNDIELKCDYNTEIFGSNTIDCQLDGSGIVRDTRFSCNAGPNCSIECDWAKVEATVIQDVGSEGFNTVQKILTSWIPQE